MEIQIERPDNIIKFRPHLAKEMRPELGPSALKALRAYVALGWKPPPHLRVYLTDQER